MPIFREHFDHDHGIPAAETTGIESPSSRPLPIHGLDKMRRQTPSRPMSRRASEESIRTDLCEGPLPDNSQPRSPERKPELDLVTMTTSDRADLIERLKRGESPTWVPNRRVRWIWPHQTAGHMIEALTDHPARPLHDSRWITPSLVEPSAKAGRFARAPHCLALPRGDRRPSTSRSRQSRQDAGGLGDRAAEVGSA